jgi:hypothetical protein
MSFYQNFPKAERKIQPVINVCQHCDSQYEVGRNGTVLGCDECLGTERNPVDGTVIEANGFFLDDNELQSS